MTYPGNAIRFRASATCSLIFSSRSFTKNSFHCFGCKAHGNAIDFVAYMEGLNPASGADVRKAALLLQEWFPERENVPSSPKCSGVSARRERPETPKAEIIACDGVTNEGQPILVNQPLDFALKDLDPAHPYLRERGFTPETISRFGLGYCNRGLLKGRIAIPLYQGGKTLVGYAGRITDDRLVSETCPKYLFPPPRERNGAMYHFHKSLVLYNAHAIAQPVDDLVVVEGFPAAWWLWQAKF